MKTTVILATAGGIGLLAILGLAGAGRGPQPAGAGSTPSVQSATTTAPGAQAEEPAQSAGQRTSDWYHQAKYVTLQVYLTQRRWWRENNVARADIAWARGGKVRFDLKYPDGTPIILIVCDGRTVWEWCPRENVYTEYDKPIFGGTDDVRLPCGGFNWCLVGNLTHSWVGPTSDIEAWLRKRVAQGKPPGPPYLPDDWNTLLEYQDEGLWWKKLIASGAKQGTQDVHGHLCDRYVVRRGRRTDIIDIDQETGIIRRRAASKPGYRTRVRTFRNIETPDTLDPTTFRFQPPPGAKRVDFAFVPQKGWVRQ